MATTRQDLGKVAYKSKGEYNSSTNYEINDVVTYQGSSYVSIQATTNHVPTNTTYWQLIAEKGDKGDTGQTGQTGATGNGIVNTQKTSTSGNVDTYTITYTNADTDTFDVVNANVVNEISSGSGNTYSCDVINTLVGDIESILTNLDIGEGVE